MAMQKYAAIIGTLGQLSDRFMACGYKEGDVPFEELLGGLRRLGVLTGVELSYASEGPLSDAAWTRDVLARSGLVPVAVNSSLFGERAWKYGSLSAADPAVRRRALRAALAGVDFARRVGAQGFNLWLGQDGFDYPFQTVYEEQWALLVDALRTICDAAPQLKITLEPKQREPRNRALVDTVPTALLLCQEVGRDNLGVTLDTGHALQAGQNIAQQIALAHCRGRLFHLHVNDNYGAWDDDMIAGSVHFLENLEMMYQLRRIRYAGWISVDIFPFREDALAAARESILYMQKFDAMVEKLTDERLEGLIRAGDVTEVLRAVREGLL